MSTRRSTVSHMSGRRRKKVYDFILELINDGQYAQWVNDKGRYVISNWPVAVQKYHELCAGRESEGQTQELNKSKASNKLRSAILNHYADDGAFEYTEERRTNENLEVVERHFQMPRKVFEKLSGDQATGYGRDEDSSDDCISREELESETNRERTASHRGAWNDQFSNLGTEEWQSGHVLSSEDFSGMEISEQTDSSHLGQQVEYETEPLSAMTTTSNPMLASQSNNVNRMFPNEDLVQGGKTFFIVLKEPFPSDVQPEVFFGLEKVEVKILNTFNLEGIVPPAPCLRPGKVIVSVEVCREDDILRGEIPFTYVNQKKQIVKSLVSDPDELVNMLEEIRLEHESRGKQKHGSIVQKKEAFIGSTGEFEMFELMVYTAAETNAHQFIRVLFSTSVGKAVFSHYKDKTLLPEEVARDNNHLELAGCLKEVHQRLSKEIKGSEKVMELNLKELAEAVQSSWHQSEIDVEHKGTENEVGSRSKYRQEEVESKSQPTARDLEKQKGTGVERKGAEEKMENRDKGRCPLLERNQGMEARSRLTESKTRVLESQKGSAQTAEKVPSEPQSSTQTERVDDGKEGTLTRTTELRTDRFAKDDSGVKQVRLGRRRETREPEKGELHRSKVLLQEVNEWQKKRRNAIKVIRKIAEDGKPGFRRTHYATWTGFGLMTAGFLAAPFTGGGSIAGALACAGAGALGGTAVAVGSSLARYYMSELGVQKVRAVLDDERKSSIKIRNLLASYPHGLALSEAGITSDIYSSVQNTLRGRQGSDFDATKAICKIADNLEKEIETVQKVVRDSVPSHGISWQESA